MTKLQWDQENYIIQVCGEKFNYRLNDTPLLKLFLELILKGKV